MNKDIRWIQRFDNYCRALERLISAVELSSQRDLTDLETQGLIQAFEFTHELAWNTLKDFLEEKGNSNLYGSKDTSRKAFKLDLIVNGEVWMNMIQSRNKTSHTYNENTAKEIVTDIINKYYHEFILLKETLTRLKKEESEES